MWSWLLRQLSACCAVTICFADKKASEAGVIQENFLHICLWNYNSADIQAKKEPPHLLRGLVSATYALSTLPDLKQEVHTYIFFAPPFAVLTLTDFTLDFHILLDLLWEWLTLFPKWALFSQIAHLAMIAPPWRFFSTYFILTDEIGFCKQKKENCKNKITFLKNQAK